MNVCQKYAMPSPWDAEPEPAIENMTLAATELGLGSLWICNTFFAQEELNHWLNADGQLYAALAVGYADEAPAPRPRRKAELTVEWRK